MFLSPGSRLNRTRRNQITARHANMAIGPYTSVPTIGVWYTGTIAGGTDSACLQYSPTFTPVSGATLYGMACAPAIAAGTATVSNFVNCRLEQMGKGTGVTVTNAYGLWVDPQTIGGTNRTIFGNGGISEIDGQLIAAGTATNDNAAAGDIGQIIETTVLVGAAVNVTNTTATDIASVFLTAGDWDVWGNLATNPAGGTTSSTTIAWISTTSATLPTVPNGGAYTALPLATAAGSGVVLPAGSTRVSLAVASNVYLSCYIAFAVSTMSAFGYIGARRRR